MNIDHGHSIPGYAMMLGDGCFSWSSKKQTATALSTGEAEYYAIFHAGHEVNWIQQLLAKLFTSIILLAFAWLKLQTKSPTAPSISILLTIGSVKKSKSRSSLPEYVPSDKNLSDIKELACALRMGLMADASWGGVLIYVYIQNALAPLVD